MCGSAARELIRDTARSARPNWTPRVIQGGAAGTATAGAAGSSTASGAGVVAAESGAVAAGSLLGLALLITGVFFLFPSSNEGEYYPSLPDEAEPDPPESLVSYCGDGADDDLENESWWQPSWVNGRGHPISCDPLTHERLQSEKQRLIDSLPGLPGTKAGLERVPCSTLQQRVEILRMVRAKREEIQATCYRWDTDPGHARQIEILDNAIRNAEALMLANCAAGHPMANL